MARLPRLIVAGLPHLLSQRAQHGQAMVRDDDDRRALLQLLRDAALQHRVALHAYSVLDARLDLVATPESDTGLSLVMQSVARRHAARYNRRHARTGGLWEGRFRVAVLDPDRWLLPAMLYVESLGGALSLVKGEPGSAAAPLWSSLPHHSGRRSDPLLSDPAVYWSLGNTPFEREASYERLLEQALTSSQIQQIEAALRGGWALGAASFQARLEATATRPASPRPRGRPRRASPGAV